MQYKKFLVIGGTHGGERTGVDVVRYLQQREAPGIKAIIGNELATKKRIRYVETDLNRSSNKMFAVSYEEQRAKHLARCIHAADVVIEFHNTLAPKNTCGIITTQPKRLHYLLASHFGISRLLIMPPDGSLSGLASKKFFSPEISKDDAKFTNVDYVYNRLLRLRELSQTKKQNVAVYRYTGVMISGATMRRLGLPVKSFHNFRIISKKRGQRLGLPRHKQFAPVFLGERGYGKEFGFQLVEKLPARS